MTTRRFCTFQVDHLLVGVEVELVQEVLGDEMLTYVPLADPCVRGLLNLRGQIVTAIDARHRLGLSPRGEDGRATNVVIRTASESVSLVVDAEGDVIDVADAAFEPVPETVSSTIRTYVTGTYKLADDLLLILDAERTLTIGAS